MGCIHGCLTIAWPSCRIHHVAGSPRDGGRYATVFLVDDEIRAAAARGLQALLDAVDLGELTAESLEELELLCRIEGAITALRESIPGS